MLVAPVLLGRNSQAIAKPYCSCWEKRSTIPRQQIICRCGEENEVIQWKWEDPKVGGNSWVMMQSKQTHVTFHPVYSSGTAAVRGDTPLRQNLHHYWEVKILTETYGTDIMVGVGTNKVNLEHYQFKFSSLLGYNAESYGLSYTGMLRHDGRVTREAAGFCRGTIVGVRLDMWHGTLEFYLNRRPQGIAFFNMRRHHALYPMLCSTAAQSGMRLIYAASWHASLLVEALKILAQSDTEQGAQLPPGLENKFKTMFWLKLPTDGASDEEEIPEAPANQILRASDMFSPQHLTSMRRCAVGADRVRTTRPRLRRFVPSVRHVTR